MEINLLSDHRDTLSLHHDLWVELARTEMALDQSNQDERTRCRLQQRQVELTEAMRRLAA